LPPPDKPVPAITDTALSALSVSSSAKLALTFVNAVLAVSPYLPFKGIVPISIICCGIIHPLEF
jgi:hypothetical protein